jgi:solute carrier family 25 carnitine/acylcarnitine transporter 20/29
MVPTLFREGHGMGMYFLVYEAVVGYKLKKDNLTRAELPALWAMLGGAISGPALWVMVYPMDVIKSRLQTDALDKGKRQYQGTLDCARQIFKQSGWKGFFRGLAPTLARAPISNAATFVTYEFAARHLEAYVR